MVKSKYLYFIIGACVLTAAAVAWFILSQSEEGKIKKQFKIISDRIEKTAGENPIVGAANAGKLKEMIFNPCRVLAPDYNIEKDISTDEIAGFIMAKRLHFSKFSITFQDFVIDITSDTTASVTLTGEVDGDLSNGEHVGDIHEYNCEMQKVDDIWKIKVIEIIEVLQQ